MLALLIVVAVVLFVFGATRASGLLTRHTDTHTRTFAAAPTIVVAAERGDVKVVAADRSDVQLTIKERRSMWGGGHADLSGDAGALHLKDRCQGVPFADDPCDVSFRLEVPRGVAVRVSSGTGDLRAENLDGSVDLRSGTGDLHVTGVRGPVRLHADTGDADVVAPTSDVSVQTGTGDIAVVATHPRTIRADTDTGDVDFVVPDLSYAVDVQTDTGDENVDVRRDDASPRKLRAHTDTGDVHVEPDG